jgi:hypothetical protein
MSHHRTRLGVFAIGFALGITWAIGLLLLGWIGKITGWGKPMIDVIGTMYLGYQATFWGAVIGAVWGFVDLFIGGIVFAAIYNACVCSKGCNHETHTSGM